ncbi:MAG: hypothetical protein PHQ27_02430 [Victivallales bacterium]|nr:hypothetical protein [Victivallales bacterium]
MFAVLSTRDSWGRPQRRRSAGEAWLAPTGGNDFHTTALLHFDGTDGSPLIVDSSRHELNFFAYGNAVISADQSAAFGGQSLKLDGSGDYVAAADSDALVIGTGAFTDEIRCWTGGIEGTATVIERRIGGGAEGYVLRINNYAWEVAIGNTTLLASAEVPSMSQFTHLAVVGNGGAHNSRTLRLYVDGVCAGTCPVDYYFTSNQLRLGTYYLGSGNFLAGYLDECRLSAQDRTANSRDPLYIPSGSTTFTPPTAAYN